MSSEIEEFRRFVLIDAKKLDKLKTLMREKNLSRDDLILILQTISLNPHIL